MMRAGWSTASPCASVRLLVATRPAALLQFELAVRGSLTAQIAADGLGVYSVMRRATR